MEASQTKSADGQKVDRSIKEEKVVREEYAKEGNKAEAGQRSVDDGSRVVEESDSCMSCLFWYL